MTSSTQISTGVTYQQPGISHIFRWIDGENVGTIVQTHDDDWTLAHEVVESARVHAKVTGSVGGVYTDDRTRVGGALTRGVWGDATLPCRTAGGTWIGNADAPTTAWCDATIEQGVERLRTLGTEIGEQTADGRHSDAQRTLDAARAVQLSINLATETKRRIADGEF